MRAMGTESLVVWSLVVGGPVGLYVVAATM